jgi:DNA topoisomerase-1
MQRENSSSQSNLSKDGYALVVCEKPDAARRISEALAEGRIDTVEVAGISAFRFRRGNEVYVVCAALGHVYAVSDPFAERAVYPVFDVEWFPYNLINKEANYARNRIESIRRLGVNAKKFINACDYDIEGETIGYNLLRYACDGKETEALRAKFSTLTKEDLLDAFKRAEMPPSNSLAIAGRTRHLIDFMWGVNLSRALSESVMSAKNRYKTISIGRVQGPALSYVVEREVGIRGFVTKPFWVVRGTFEVNGVSLDASYATERILKKSEAEIIQKECRGKDAVVSHVTRSTFVQSRPPPFNIGDLQKEAYRFFGYSPSRTLQIAERLYLDALISYPRTSSQKLPPSINYRRTLQNLGKILEYSKETQELLGGALVPKEGAQSDPAHPAIYPTGEGPRRRFEAWELRLFDLIVRRFLATFAEDALRQRVAVSISVDKHEFKSIGRRTLKEGWLKVYRKYSDTNDNAIPDLEEGDVLKVIAVENHERFESRPPRYNQGSLLEKMEEERLGTKATRAEIISTLINRGYIAGESLMATDLGFSVIETMERHSPAVISTKLTRDTEERLERIERGEEGANELIAETIQEISDQLLVFKSNEAAIGEEMDQSILAVRSAQNTLGVCPVCKNGKLIMLRSKKTGKRFVGCTNYSKGCRASAPLPQKGIIRTTQSTCNHCGWPVIYVRLGKAPWRLCVNINCPTKVRRKYEMSAVQKRK